MADESDYVISVQPPVPQDLDPDNGSDSIHPAGSDSSATTHSNNMPCVISEALSASRIYGTVGASPVTPTNCGKVDVLLLLPLDESITIWLDDENGRCINTRLTIKDIAFGYPNTHPVYIQAYNLIEGVNSAGDPNVTTNYTGGYSIDGTGGSVTFVLTCVQDGDQSSYMWIIESEVAGRPRHI